MGFRHLKPLPASVVVELAAPTTVEGTIRLAAGSGTPEFNLWGMTIFPQGEHEDDERREMSAMTAHTRIEADGRFRCTGLHPGKYQLDLSDELYESVPFNITGRNNAVFEVREGETTRLDIQAEWRPPRPTELRGLVLIDGRPAGGLRIAAVDYLRSERFVSTGKDGSFDLGRVLEGEIELQVLARGPGGILDSLFADTIEIEAGKDVHLTIRIDTGVLAGQVLGLDGLPVPNVRVQAEGDLPSAEAMDAEVKLSATTDKHGQFRFGHAPAARYQLTVDLFDRRARLAGIQLAAGHAIEGLKLALQPSVAIRGHLDCTGLGIRGPVFGDISLEGPVERVATLKDDGTFQVDDLYAGKYRVRLWLCAKHPREGLRRPLLEVDLREPVRIDQQDVVGVRLVVDGSYEDAILDKASGARRAAKGSKRARKRKRKYKTLQEFLSACGFQLAR
jgi:hypothetical protein